MYKFIKNKWVLAFLWANSIFFAMVYPSVGWAIFFVTAVLWTMADNDFFNKNKLA